jgi:Histidine kinase-, DNA gyrase B-, and HSP90-like ATPase
VGRISNISLAPSPNNALAPLFEAITNAIQAVEDQFGIDHIAKGRIDVEVLRPRIDQAKPSGFTIRDNGIGFNDANLDSFFTSDSRYKLAKGGKGVGRFLWLKVFQKAHVSSRYED